MISFDEYSDKFAIFDNTDMEIIRLMDYDDYANTYNAEVIGIVRGDLQDYSGMLAEKEYGLDIECQKVFYCHNAEDIDIGMYLSSGKQTYKVMNVSKWDFGSVIMLKEADIDL